MYLPEWLINFITIASGLIIGSFLNVIVVRLPLKQSVIAPRSHCPICKKNINWWENIPLFSYLYLRGKCSGCNAAISARYPLIEFLTALLFFTCKTKFGWSSALIFHDWPFVSILIAVTFIDLEHRIIPDVLSLGGLGLGLLTSWMILDPGWQNALIGGVLGFISFYALAWIYYRFSGRAGLGGGDIKLLAMIGAFLGPAGVFATVFISSVFGSIIGIIWAFASKQKDMMKLSIPYGPFLVFGALYYYLLGDILWFQFTTPM